MQLLSPASLHPNWRVFEQYNAPVVPVGVILDGSSLKQISNSEFAEFPKNVSASVHHVLVGWGHSTKVHVPCSQAITVGKSGESGTNSALLIRAGHTMHSMLGSDDDRLSQIDVFYFGAAALAVMVHRACMMVYVALEIAVELVGALSFLSVMMPPTTQKYLLFPRPLIRVHPFRNECLFRTIC